MKDEIHIEEQDLYSEYVAMSEIMYCYELEEINNKLAEIYIEEYLDK
jgi:hypothetical protein